MEPPQLNKEQKEVEESSSRGLGSYSKYSGLVIQMGIIIAITVWGGVKLDELANSKPVFTIILSLFGVFTAIYIPIKDFIKN